MQNIIDISQFNGMIDFNKVKGHVDGVIIRVGYRGYGSGKISVDTRAINNLAGATAAGIPVGVYFVTQAISEAEAVGEAVYVLDVIKRYKISLPVFIDSENGSRIGKGRADAGMISKAKRTAILRSFCEKVKSEGYTAGIYASESWYNTQLIFADISDFYIWVAKYSAVSPNVKYNAWQYTDSAIINGIVGNVDASRFNETKKPAPAKKSNEEIADEVIAGKWGNGSERRKKLEAAGYNYNDVQSIVNNKLKPKTEKVYYKIKKGDTLTAIAKKYGTTINKLKTLNNIKNANMIYAGQTIRIK